MLKGRDGNSHSRGRERDRDVAPLSRDRDSSASPSILSQSQTQEMILIKELTSKLLAAEKRIQELEGMIRIQDQGMLEEELDVLYQITI